MVGARNCFQGLRKRDSWNIDHTDHGSVKLGVGGVFPSEEVQLASSTASADERVDREWGKVVW